MTLEYVLLLVIGGALFMTTLMSAPKKAFDQGGMRLAARVETQIATGTGFKPYPVGRDDEEKRVPWVQER
ncbi:hypothetical protein A11Q_2367 [Pseudobdellovibrio exovorus JSS]|uniref:Uncharacterized protein n=2 Tax=Pseudobdellovibrio exovorus TaxID=453816 RepID=M4VBJ7_9BACT|nr:hypothetical protein A11Q_2367 [Pseudobdellovibrio exovorus JSS]